MNHVFISSDLANGAPHSPRERLAGFAIACRTIDKCRASLAGTLGEYHYDCQLDNLLFSFKNITGDQFTKAVQAAKDYEAVGAWLTTSGTPKTALQIRTWSDETEALSLMKNPEKRPYFIEHCHNLGLNPETNSTFDMLEADDRASFGRKS
jgi:hypothetical protein